MIAFPRFDDPSGCLAVLDLEGDLPFRVRRLFFVEDIPSGAVRGDHAHYQTQELIIALGGDIDVTLESGAGLESFRLTRSAKALHVPAMAWITLKAISDKASCLVLASTPYDESDYIRDRNEFRKLIAP